MAVQTSVSSGAIIFRTRNGEREYLVMKSRANDWEFPKGGVEGNEELQQTALREIEEETGIHDVKLIDGFRREYDYKFQAGKNVIEKTVHLFIAKTFDPSVNLSKEHHDYQWRSYDEAYGTLTHGTVKNILSDAEEFLEENNIK